MTSHVGLATGGPEGLTIAYQMTVIMIMVHMSQDRVTIKQCLCSFFLARIAVLCDLLLETK